ncbi:type A von willebrand factor domain protein (macronuclear) [Tetrahymena thermophila SB210]|uniref:Type A von willebrand factor domain protein n=1 Tax=Tetrahymena thermophila (strain SB210) TaxID=312017 RepID=Q23A45_TETTS|nr:type A von willebrand factor domain protein [Tetrahymena thermophila SB210]EAR93435.3 type A von willebrand factor domain protein [Tetrahymena thermophila SB210]|eukprot:XP_001013680.3 type A von willebrand factor domain protein [Tetrahymena thermophila SB210]
MNSANAFCYVPKNSEDKKIYKNQVNQKITSNIIEINFSNLKKLQKNYVQQTPNFCISCQASLNHLSIVKQRDGQTVWQCEFCDYVNPLNVPYNNNLIPKEKDVFFMLEKSNQKNKVQQQEEEQKQSKQQEYSMNIENDQDADLNDQRTIIFCLDNSGSMSSGTVFKDQDGESRYMSRKACVEKAIHSQILEMQKKYPNRKVGIVLFSKDVTILGDCQSAPVSISKEGQFDKLFELGQNHYENLFKNNVSQVNNMPQKYKEIRTNGSTALGPGLAVSLGLASQSPQSGSSIILCTDGLANEGIGQLEDKKDYETYEKMGQLAKSLGILIHTITMRGNESDVRVLGKLSDTTGGRTSRVGPADFNSNFVELVSSDLVATKVEIVVQLHEGLVMIEGSPHTDLGNATENSSITYQYAVKDNYDFKGRNSIPIQSKIFFSTLQGDKMVRIITQEQKITYEYQQAVQEVQINILSKHANKVNAQQALFGSAPQAQQQQALWGNFIKNQVQPDNFSQQAQYNVHCQQQQKLDKAINKKIAHIEKNDDNKQELDDVDQECFDMF